MTVTKTKTLANELSIGTEKFYDYYVAGTGKSLYAWLWNHRGSSLLGIELTDRNGNVVGRVKEMELSEETKRPARFVLEK